MHYTRWLTIALAILLIASCYFPWVVIAEKNIVISGVAAEGTRWGRPGYFTILVSAIILLLALIPRIWAQRISIFTAALNIGWTLRNFFVLSACSGGICPERQPAFYAYLILALLLFASIIIQKMNLPPSDD
jgi:hypothetical protein